MDLFDSAIFDSAVFDTGSEVQGELNPIIVWERAKRVHRLRKEREALEQQLKEQAREEVAEIVEHASPDVEPALEIAPPLPVYDPRLADVVADHLAADIAGQLAAIAQQQRAEALQRQLIQIQQDEEAAQALLAWLMH